MLTYAAATAMAAAAINGSAPASRAEGPQAPRDREGLTGQQLFEHEWKWTGPATRRVNRRGSAPSITGDGLGPLHNATSCVACHVDGGGSDVTHNVTLITIDPRSRALKSPTTGGKELLELFPGVLGPRGLLNFDALVHDRSTRDGYDKIRNRLAESVPGGIDDEWFVPQRRNVAAIAARPVVAGRHGNVDYYLSQRNSQALFGLGEIASISDDRIRALAKRQAIATGGEISGRFTGKFGWRGQVQTVAAFVSGACAAELGLTQRSPLRPGGATSVAVQADDPADPSYVNFGSDMTHDELGRLVQYVATLPRPIEHRDDSIDDVLAGEQIFNSTGCVQCHVADLRPVSGLFSDLLLHDMGPELQAPSPAPIGDLKVVATMSAPIFTSAARSSSSGSVYYSAPNPSIPAPYPLVAPERPQFPRGELPRPALADGLRLTWDELQREWRTPPLWGVADTAPYLHDGRAETLEEAIQWHGGEAQSSRQRYSELSRHDRDLLIKFLSSLRAPTTK